MTPYEGASLLVSVAGIVALLVSVGYLAKQTREMAKQTEAAVQASLGSPFDRVAAQMFQMDQVFVDHPEFRVYFYDGVHVPHEGDAMQRALAIAEMRLDFFDQVLKEDGSNPSLWPFGMWEPHITSALSQSPVMRDYLMRMRNSYSPKLVELGFIAVARQSFSSVEAAAGPDDKAAPVD